MKSTPKSAVGVFPCGSTVGQFSGGRIMQKSTFLGRYGEAQERCIDEGGRFASCDGRSNLGLARIPPGYKPMGMGYGRGMGLALPVIGPVSFPRTIQFDAIPGLIGIGLGKVGPALVSGILGRIVTGGEAWTQIVVGVLSGLALASEKWRRNSYFVGFAITALPDMLTPMLEGILDTVMPKTNGTSSAQGARRMGFVTAAEQAALRRAQGRLLSSADGGGFVGRNIMLPSEYVALTKKSPLSGASLNDNGLRNIA
jgi:hypothetical protein